MSNEDFSGELVISADFMNQPKETEQQDAPKVDEGDDQQEEVETEEQQAPEVEPDQKAATGWLNYDDYVEAGNDPEMYRGKGAWDQFKEKEKASKGRERDTLEQMAQLVKVQQQQVQMATEKAKQDTRKQIETELAQARDDLDADQIQKKSIELHNHDNSAAAAPQSAAAPHPLVTDIQSKNPELDPSSNQYSKALDLVFQNAISEEMGKAMPLDANGQLIRQPSDYEVSSVLNAALASARQLLPKSTEKPPLRRAPASTRPRGGKPSADPVSSLTPEAKTLYNHFKNKGMHAAAKDFAKSMHSNG